MMTRRQFLQARSPSAAARSPSAAAQAAPPWPADPIHHLLNRLTWGPRPDDLAYARQIGHDAYLEEQLAPAGLADDACDRRLASLALLTLDRHALYGLQDASERCYRAMVQAFLLRAVHSRRQLATRMAAFWADHFNVYLEDEAPDVLLFLRDVIEPHALGRFRDLLIATAQSPAMLVYLDNFVNVAAHPNENYARELLELHTLGVDGGYSEQDVREVARAFTGWTVHNGTRRGFYFNPAEHDSGAKRVLGHALPAGRGIEDGLHVLGLLAAHPQTARFVSHKLAAHFVRDDPPADLVARMAAAWQETGGDLPSVLRALFQSPEFRAAAGQKLRRPLDFFVGALRATGTEVSDWWVLQELLLQLGQPPYRWHPPNGYPDAAAAWISTQGLLARWNAAMRLTHGAAADPDDQGWGMRSALWKRAGRPATVGELVDGVAAQVFGAPLPAAAREPFIAYAGDGQGADTAVSTRLLGRKLPSLFGLMLASPLYQWR